MSDPAPRRRFSNRARLVTIASVLAVGAAGAVAVSANIGILRAADNSTLGELAAAGDLTTPPAPVVQGEPDGASSTTAPQLPVDGGTVHTFAVDAAGTVRLAAVDDDVRLDGVAPRDGWTWTLVQRRPSELTVSFTDGNRTLEFVASSHSGAIGASVDEIVPGGGEPLPAVVSERAETHDDDDRGGEEHEHDDDHDHAEYEGGEDDD